MAWIFSFPTFIHHSSLQKPPSILQPPSCRLSQQIWSLFSSALQNPKKKISRYKTNTQSESRFSKVKPYALLFLFHHNCNFLYHNSSAPCHLSLGHFAVLFHLPADLSGLLGLSLLFPLFFPQWSFQSATHCAAALSAAPLCRLQPQTR